MPYFEIKYRRFAVVLLVIFIAALVQNQTLSFAKERQTMKDGVAECKSWCDRNNKTVASQHSCYVNCEKYWLCKGSDATAITCADGRALSIEQVAPTDPTPKPKRPLVGKKATSIEPAN